MNDVHEQWPIPAGLTEAGRRAATAITEFLIAHNLTDHYGGGKFYTPEQWAERGEEYGTDSLVILTHDGGQHAPAFNYAYENDKLRERMAAHLRRHQLRVEQCTAWYSAVYAA